MRKNSYRRKLNLESLESRKCLATTAAVSSGNLTITSDSAADLLLQQTAADSWTVSDGANPVGNFSGITGNVTVKTSSANDTIEVDLNGQTAPKSIVVQTGNGTNSVNVHGGTVVKNLDIVGGSGDDSVTISGATVNSLTRLITGHGNNDVALTNSTLLKTLGISTGSGEDRIVLGNGIDPVSIAGIAAVIDKGGPLDELEVSSGVSLGALLTSAVNDVALRVGSEVTGGVLIRGGRDVANSLTLAGVIDGSVVFTGSTSVDSLNQTATSTIGGSLVAYTKGGDDWVEIEGDIGNSVYLDTNSGNDTVSLSGAVGNHASIYLGSGDDFFELLGTIGVAPANSSRFRLDGGSGNDQLALRAGSEVNGQASVNLGAGDDILVVDDSAMIVAASILGGTGNDTYYGTLPRSGIVQKLFELFSTDPAPF